MDETKQTVLNVRLTGDQARQEIKNFKSEVEKLKKELKALSDPTQIKIKKEELNKAEADLKSLKKELRKLSDPAEVKLKKDQIVKAELNVAALNKELQRLKDPTPVNIKEGQIKLAEAEIAKLKASIKENLTVIINGEVAGKSLKDLRAAMRLAKLEFEGMVDPAESRMQANRINVIQKQIDNLQAPLVKSKSAFAGIFDEMKRMAAIAASAFGLNYILHWTQDILTSNAKISDSIADIQRVSGLSAQEANELNKSLREIDSRTSMQGLRDLAIVSAKLGEKGVKNISDYSQALDMLVVALGDELGGASEISEKLGKILNVFKGNVTAKDITNLGNAFVELANDGVASGAFMADFVQRTTATGKAANFTLGSLVGLGAGFEELGLRSESSSTAFQKLVNDIGADLPKAAKIAKKPVAEFQQLFANNPEKALIAYAKGLVLNKESFGEVITSFKDAGEEGARVITTLQTIGGSSEYLQKKIDLGNKSMQESNAITDAFRLKNESLGAVLDKIGKITASWFANNSAANFFKGLAESFYNLIKPGDMLIENADKIVKANRAQIATANSLKKEYEELTKEGVVPTTQSKERLKIITLQMKDALGESVVSLNKETGALVLNVNAVKEAIKQKLLLNNTEAATLALKADNAKNEKSDLASGAKQQAEELITRMDILKTLGLSQEQAHNYYQILLEGSAKSIALERQLGSEKINAINAYEKSLSASYQLSGKIAAKEAERLAYVKELKKLGFDEKDLANLFKAPEDTTQTTTKKTVLETNVTGGKESDQQFRERMDKLSKQLSEQLTKITTFGIEEQEAWRENGRLYLKEQQYANLRSLEEEERSTKAMLDLAETGSSEQEKAKNAHRLALNNIDAFWNSKDIEETVKAEKLRIEKVSEEQKIGLETRLKEEMEGIKIKLQLVEAGSEEEISLKTQLVEDEFKIAIEGVEKESQAYIQAIIDRNKKIDEINKKHDANEAARIIENIKVVQSGLQDFVTIYSGYDNYRTLRENNLTTHERNEAARRKRIALDEFNSGKITKENYNAEIARIEVQADNADTERRRKQFERNKKLTEAQIAINTAGAIMEIWQKYAENYYLAAALSLIVGGIGLAQISEVESQEFPEYGKGGILKGPKHKDKLKGIELRDSAGRTFARAEGGELIGSAAFVENNPEVAKMVLDSSANNGARINLSEEINSGSLGISSSTPLPQFNTRALNRTFSKRSTLSSDTTSTSQPSEGKGLVNLSEPQGETLRLYNLIIAQNERIESLTLKITNLKVINEYKTWQKDVKKFENQLKQSEL